MEDVPPRPDGQVIRQLPHIATPKSYLQHRIAHRPRNSSMTQNPVDRDQREALVR